MTQLEGEFWRATLLKLGSDEQLLRWIMKCVTSESYSLLINDHSVGMKWTDFRVGFSSLSFAFHGLNPDFIRQAKKEGWKFIKFLGITVDNNMVPIY